MSEMSRRYCGSAFQSVGPEMLKALLPAKVDRVNGLIHCDHNLELYALYDWQPVKVL